MKQQNKRFEDKKKRRGSFLFKLIGGAAVIFFIIAAASFPLKTVYYTVYSGKIKKQLRIAQISDLHSCRYGKNMSELIQALDKASPDAVVLTGDIYDDVVPNGNTRAFLKAAAPKYPCFYIAGNHENRKGEWASFKSEAEGFGVTVLEGDALCFEGINICGAAAAADGSFGFDDSVEKCAESATEGFNLLLAHYPEKIDFYRSSGKFDLVLSGHAHGGQWRIPGLINGLYAPGQGLFPEYAGGRYDFEDCTMIVSRGLSRTKNVIPRIFNNPELVVVDIETEDRSSDARG